MKKRTHSYKRRKYNHQHNEVKEKLYTNSFNYFWTIFENQVKHMYTSQKVEVFSRLRMPQAHFSQAHGHQRAGALQAPLTTFKTQWLQYTKENIKRQLKQKLENGVIGFHK